MESTLKLHICYERLSPRTLSRMLASIAAMSEVISKTYARTSTWDWRKTPPHFPVLDISYASTGDSIKIVFKDGWKPKVIVDPPIKPIELPSAIGVALLIGLALGATAWFGLTVQNEVLQNRLLRRQLAALPVETRQLVAENPSLLPRLNAAANDVLKFAIEDSDITKFSVNGINILPRQNRNPGDQTED